MNNGSFLLPVFSSIQSDFQEDEKIPNQIWPRSRLPLSAIEILSDEEENLRENPEISDLKTIDHDKNPNIIGRTPQINFENASNQPNVKNLNASNFENIGALLRGDANENEQKEKGKLCFCKFVNCLDNNSKLFMFCIFLNDIIFTGLNFLGINSNKLEMIIST